MRQPVEFFQVFKTICSVGVGPAVPVPAPLRFASAICAQKIAGIVPKKIGKNANGSGDGGRKFHQLRFQNGFLSLGFFFQRGNDLQQIS